MDYEKAQDEFREALRYEDLGAAGLPDGVEREEDEPFPFDAEKISITNKTVPLETLLRRLRQGSVSSPPIQRGANIWGDSQQSRLIESLMLRIPLPLFYVAADEKEHWKVVDGLQRITAIRRFIQDKAFKLSGLEFLKKHDGDDFESLPSFYQNRILETELQFAVISPSTPEPVQRNIFKRLNTGGLPLTAQEIRHALYYGPAAELLQELVGLEAFKTATDNRVDDSRMAGRELVLRFLAVLVFGPEQYPPTGDMDSFLCDAMKVINEPTRKNWGPQEATPPVPKLTDRNALKTNFCCAMTRAKQIFGRYAFRKSLPDFSRQRTPVNKALFEVWSCQLSHITDDTFQRLLERKKKLFTALHEDVYVKDNGRFLDAISQNSHNPASMKYRHMAIESCIREIGGQA